MVLVIIIVGGGCLLLMVLKGVPPFVENGLGKAVSLWFEKGFTLLTFFDVGGVYLLHLNIENVMWCNTD